MNSHSKEILQIALLLGAIVALSLFLPA